MAESIFRQTQKRRLEIPQQQEKSKKKQKSNRGDPPLPSSDDSDADRPTSPTSRCPICLLVLNNPSYTDTCLHEFCFLCIKQWSQIKHECPLCKQLFRTIMHSVRSMDDYEEYHLPPLVSEQASAQANASVVDMMGDQDGFGDFSVRITNSNTNLRFSLAMVGAPEPYGSRLASMFAAIPTRRRRPRLQYSLAGDREEVYRRNLWVRPASQQQGLYRQSSPTFYRNNEALTHRLVLWLTREVRTLVSLPGAPDRRPSIPGASTDSGRGPSESGEEAEETYVQNIVSRFMQHILVYSIRHPQMIGLAKFYFGNAAYHFIHEFYSFATSMYDMVGYDREAQYVASDMVQFYVDLTSPAHSTSSRGLSRTHGAEYDQEPEEVDDVEILDELVSNIPDSQIMYDGILASRQHRTEPSSTRGRRRPGNTGTEATNQDAASGHVTRSGRSRGGEREDEDEDDDIIFISPPPVEVVDILSSEDETNGDTGSSGSRPDHQGRYRRATPRPLSHTSDSLSPSPEREEESDPAGSDAEYFPPHAASSATSGARLRGARRGGPRGARGSTRTRPGRGLQNVVPDESNQGEDEGEAPRGTRRGRRGTNARRRASESVRGVFGSSAHEYVPPFTPPASVPIASVSPALMQTLLGRDGPASSAGSRRQGRSSRSTSGASSRERPSRPVRPAPGSSVSPPAAMACTSRSTTEGGPRSNDSFEDDEVDQEEPRQSRQVGRSQKKKQTPKQTSKKQKETQKSKKKKGQKPEPRMVLAHSGSSGDEWAPTEDEEGVSEGERTTEMRRENRRNLPAHGGKYSEASEENSDENTDTSDSNTSSTRHTSKGKRQAISGSKRVNRNGAYPKRNKSQAKSSESEESGSEGFAIDARRDNLVTRKESPGYSGSKGVKSGQPGPSNSKSSKSSSSKSNKKFGNQICSSTRDENSDAVTVFLHPNETSSRFFSSSSHTVGLSGRERRPSVVIVKGPSSNGANEVRKKTVDKRLKNKTENGKHTSEGSRSCSSKSKGTGTKDMGGRRTQNNAQKLNRRRLASESSSDEIEEFNDQRTRDRDERCESNEMSEQSDPEDIQERGRGRPQREFKNQRRTVINSSDSNMADNQELEENETNDDEQSERSRHSKTSGDRVTRTKSRNSESTDGSSRSVSAHNFVELTRTESQKNKTKRKNKDRSSENETDDNRGKHTNENESGTSQKIYRKGQVKFKKVEGGKIIKVSCAPMSVHIQKRARYDEQSSSESDDARDQEDIDEDLDDVRTHDEETDTDGSNEGNGGMQGNRKSGKSRGKENDGSRKNDNGKKQSGSGESSSRRQYKTKGHDERVYDGEHSDSQEDDICDQPSEEEREGIVETENIKRKKGTENLDDQLEIKNNDDGLLCVNNSDQEIDSSVLDRKKEADAGCSEQVRVIESTDVEGAVQVCDDDAVIKEIASSEGNRTGQNDEQSDYKKGQEMSSEKCQEKLRPEKQSDVDKRETVKYTVEVDEYNCQDVQNVLGVVDQPQCATTKHIAKLDTSQTKDSKDIVEVPKPKHEDSNSTKSFRDDNQQPTCSKYLNNDSREYQETTLPGIETLIRLRSKNNNSQSSGSSIDECLAEKDACQRNENGEYLRLSQLDAVGSQEAHVNTSGTSHNMASSSQGAYVKSAQEEIIDVEMSDDDRSRPSKQKGYTIRNDVVIGETDDDEVITVDDVIDCKRTKEVVVLSSDDDREVRPVSILSNRQINYQRKKFITGAKSGGDNEVEVIVEHRSKAGSDRDVVVLESDDDVVNEMNHNGGPSESQLIRENNRRDTQARTNDTDGEIVEVDSPTRPFDILSTIENLANDIQSTVGEIREQDRQHEARSREKLLRKQYRRMLREELRRDVQAANRREKERSGPNADDLEGIHIDPSDAIFGPSLSENLNDAQLPSSSQELRENLIHQNHTHSTIQKPDQFSKSQNEYFTNRNSTDSNGSSVLNVEFETLDNSAKQGDRNESLVDETATIDIISEGKHQETIDVDTLDENYQVENDLFLCIQNESISTSKPTILENQNDSTNSRNPKEHRRNHTKNNPIENETPGGDVVKRNERVKKDNEVIHVQDADDEGDCDSDDVQPIPVTSDIDVVNNSSTENSQEAFTEVLQPREPRHEDGESKNSTNSSRCATSSKDYIRKLLKWNHVWNSHKQRISTTVGSTESGTDPDSARAKCYESTISKGNFSGSSSDLVMSSSYYAPESNNATLVSGYATCEAPAWCGDNQSTLSSGSPVNYTIYENRTKQVATRVLCDANRMNGSSKRCATGGGGRIMEITTQETYDVVKIEHKKNRRKQDLSLRDAERLAVQTVEPAGNLSNGSLLGRNSRVLLTNLHRSAEEFTLGARQSQSLVRTSHMLAENDEEVRVKSNSGRKKSRSENRSPPLDISSKTSNRVTESYLEPYPRLASTSVGADPEYPGRVYGSYYTPMHTGYLTYYNNRFNETDSPLSSRYFSDEEKGSATSRRAQHKACSESVKREPSESDDVNVDIDDEGLESALASKQERYPDNLGSTSVNSRYHDNPDPTSSVDSEEDSVTDSDSSSGYKSSKRRGKKSKKRHQHLDDGSKQRHSKHRHKKKAENEKPHRTKADDDTKDIFDGENRRDPKSGKLAGNLSTKNGKSKNRRKTGETKTYSNMKTDLLDHTHRIKTEQISDHDPDSRNGCSEYYINSKRENSDYHIDSKRENSDYHIDSKRDNSDYHTDSKRENSDYHIDSKRENSDYHIDSKRENSDYHIDSKRDNSDYLISIRKRINSDLYSVRNTDTRIDLKEDRDSRQNNENGKHRRNYYRHRHSSTESNQSRSLSNHSKQRNHGNDTYSDSSHSKYERNHGNDTHGDSSHSKHERNHGNDTHRKSSHSKHRRSHGNDQSESESVSSRSLSLSSSQSKHSFKKSSSKKKSKSKKSKKSKKEGKARLISCGKSKGK